MTPEMLRELLNSPARLDALWGLRLPSRIAFDTFSTITNSHNILPFNKDRIGLLFVGPNSGRVTLSNDSGVVIDNGLTISSTSGTLDLTVSKHGLCVQKEWYCIGSAAGSVVSWIEIVIPPSQ